MQCIPSPWLAGLHQSWRVSTENGRKRLIAEGKMGACCNRKNHSQQHLARSPISKPNVCHVPSCSNSCGALGLVQRGTNSAGSSGSVHSGAARLLWARRPVKAGAPFWSPFSFFTESKENLNPSTCPGNRDRGLASPARGLCDTWGMDRATAEAVLMWVVSGRLTQ